MGNAKHRKGTAVPCEEKITMKDFNKNRVRTPHPVGGETMTEQHHEKACNINSIMAKYAKTGLIDHVNRHKGTYGDVTGADFKAAQDLIAEQKTIFYELPAKVRAELDHDPANYLELVMTEEGQLELAAIINPAPAGPESDPPKPDSGGSNDGEAEQAAVT